MLKRSLFPTPIVTQLISLSHEEAAAIHRGVEIASAMMSEQQLADRMVHESIPSLAHVYKAVEDSLHMLAPHCNWTICSMKLNTMCNGSIQRFHMHRDVDAFCVVYLTDVHNQSGDLILHDPRFVDHPTIDSYDSCCSITPTVGLIVTVPSYVWHSVEPYFGTSDRVSLVYNATAKRNT